MTALDDPRAPPILDVLAREARISVERLTANARTDELGLTELELAFALFEIEDRFDIDLPQQGADGTALTVDAVVQQVLTRLDQRAASMALG